MRFGAAAAAAAWVAVVVPALLFGMTCHGAAASSAPPGAKPVRLLLFSGIDIWRDGRFTHGGLVVSPGGIDRDGFTLKLMSNGGVYRFQSGTFGGIDVIGQELGGLILPGWRFVRERTTVVAMAGLDVQNHRLVPDDPSAGLRGTYAGAAAAFEIWHVPKAGTMAAADASFSTIGPSYSVRMAFGWRLRDRFYLGPEKQILSSGNTHRQVRLGLHLTGLRMRGSEWSAGVGWSSGSDARQGTYGRLSVLTRL